MSDAVVSILILPLVAALVLVMELSRFGSLAEAKESGCGL